MGLLKEQGHRLYVVWNNLAKQGRYVDGFLDLYSVVENVRH
jgi:hypothetical protein